jgi:hypothetical protein
MKGDIHTIQLAAEDFGIMSDGRYALDLDQDSTNGVPMVKLLPGGMRFPNAFTGAQTEPRLGPPPVSPPQGSIWYEAFCDSTHAVVAYRITGFSRAGRVLLEVTSDNRNLGPLIPATLLSQSSRSP